MPAMKPTKDESGSAQTLNATPAPKRTQPERRPALVSLRGELMAVPIPLERDEVTIGRAFEADVRLNDSRASRLHARITRHRGSVENADVYRISDLGSTNGTTVN